MLYELAQNTKFRTFIKYKDLPEKLKEAATIVFDADYCEKLYTEEGDLLFDRISQNQAERALDSGIHEEEEKGKINLLLNFMEKFNVKFIED